MAFKDFRLIETLGKGSFASVYKVVRKSDNKVYALKRVKLKAMSKREIADALKEIQFLASVRQNNIVGFLEAFLESNDTELCIVMEYCGCGDLSQKVERYKRRRQYIDEDVLWRYLIQCLKALECLHSHGICHRDLKSANTFIADDGSIKIGDMNVSKRLGRGDMLKTQIGTPYYMAPEIWNNRPYDFKCDMWSLGCMMYELAALRPPFTADSFPALRRVVNSGRFSPMPRKYSENFKRTVGSMLKQSARERPSPSAMLNSPELASKLQLDRLVARKIEDQNSARSNLMDTIKVPQVLRKVALPKPCYPDMRPNSPSSWTVAEQQEYQKQQAAIILESRERRLADISEVDENESETERSVRSSLGSLQSERSSKRPSIVEEMNAIDRGCQARSEARRQANIEAIRAAAEVRRSEARAVGYGNKENKISIGGVGRKPSVSSACSSNYEGNKVNYTSNGQAPRLRPVNGAVVAEQPAPPPLPAPPLSRAYVKPSSIITPASIAAAKHISRLGNGAKPYVPYPPAPHNAAPAPVRERRPSRPGHAMNAVALAGPAGRPTAGRPSTHARPAAAAGYARPQYNLYRMW